MSVSIRRVGLSAAAAALLSILAIPNASAQQPPPIPGRPVVQDPNVVPAGFPDVPPSTLPAAVPPKPEPPSTIPGVPSGPDRLNSVLSGGALDEAAVRSIVDNAFKERDAKKRADDTAKEKSAVAGLDFGGGNVPLIPYWDNGLWFASANNDWKIHVGGRFQAENVSWAQPLNLRGAPPGNGGIQASGRNDGVGTLEDGFFFRRVRFRTDGVGYGMYEYAIEVDFEQLNLITYDHLWVGAFDDYWGTLRVGNHKIPQGLEMMGSDYHLTFLERSAMSDSIWTLFGTGVYYMNDFFNKNVVFQTMVHRIQPIQAFTGDYGNGNYAETSRLTWTPIYADEGARIVHVGGSYQYRTGDIGHTIQPGGTGSAYGDTQDVIRLRARPQMRDALGVGNVNFLGSNANRFVDTGFLLTDGASTISPEFLLIHGPFSIQSEAGFSKMNHARSLYGGNGVAPGQDLGNPMFWGYYGEASYILTGEHRGYDRRMGMYDRIKVKHNAGYTRDESGCKHWGWGAWQIAYRYSYLDLNDSNVNGGQLIQHEFGLNWYLNDNTKVQFMYLNARRNVIDPAVSGNVNGFGILAQWYF